MLFGKPATDISVTVRIACSGVTIANIYGRFKMNLIGKKQRQWILDRARLIGYGVQTGAIQIVGGEVRGRCAICGEWKTLDPDHIKKRSQGGLNIPDNIRWICRECHEREDNMPNSPKQSTKKAEWQKLHQCKNCKRFTSLLYCNFCGKLSVGR